MAPLLRETRMEDNNMARTAASTARKTPAKDTAAKEPTPEAPTETTPATPEAPAETTPAAPATAAPAAGGAAEPVVTIEEAPKPEAAPAASTAPLEPPAAPLPVEAPPTPPAANQLAAASVAGDSRATVSVIDDETQKPLGPEDVDGLFERVNESATIVRATRRLLRKVQIPPYGQETCVLLVAKGTTLPEKDARFIESLIRPAG